ncbi:hypothetical protein Pst134EB_008128 [Puccinia striiformis f. sp. tritici]|nr:hypothetical protein Pst134EB_008128 [Puccinia striiformis f. sp. tritici]
MEPIYSSQQAISTLAEEPIPEHVRIIDICEYINTHALSPKKFFLALMKSTDDRLVNRRSKWPSSGLDSTMELLNELVKLVKKTKEGSKQWNNLIFREAVDIVDHQKTDSGYWPKGLFQSSTTVTTEFLNDQTTQKYNHRLTRNGMPFLYGLVNGVLLSSFENKMKAPEEEPEELNTNLDDNDAEGLHMEAIGYKQLPLSQLRARDRFDWIATLVCGMVAFARNRRHNGMQLRNAIQLVACGVTDRVNQYLMYHGLVCGQRTAMTSLKHLSIKGESRLKAWFAAHRQSYWFSPIICIDNLDIEERVHTHAVGNRTRTFHGTWGYIQFPSQDLLDSLDVSEITLEKFNEAMRKVPTFPIQPRMLMPNQESKSVYKDVWKSQIARVMSEYVATPRNSTTAISLNPPVVEQISRTPPEIEMLKLMDASENSAEGIGQVLDSLCEQSGIDPEDFCTDLLLMDGDLATCRNFNSLRSLRTPSKYPQHSLHNTVFQLGASHTLWNIASCIFKTHFGDPEDSSDTGAWRILHSLGVPHNKAMPKNDYSLQIKYIEKVHEATILAGLK